MIRIGIPAGLQSTIFSISNVLIQSSINSFGSVVIAGNSAASNIENFIGIATNSIHHAGVSFVSQNLGAGKPDRVRRIAGNCYFLVFLIGTVLSVGVYLLGRPLLGIFTPDAAVIEAGMIRITWVGLSHMLCGGVDVACGLVRGLGRSWLPMIVTLVGACLFRIIWIFTVFAKFPRLDVLYAAYPITWALTLLAHTVCIIVLIRKLFQHTPLKKASPAPVSETSAKQEA